MSEALLGIIGSFGVIFVGAAFWLAYNHPIAFARISNAVYIAALAVLIFLSGWVCALAYAAPERLADLPYGWVGVGFIVLFVSILLMQRLHMLKDEPRQPSKQRDAD